jgi:hypothetical protein
MSHCDVVILLFVTHHQRVLLGLHGPLACMSFRSRATSSTLPCSSMAAAAVTPLYVIVMRLQFPPLQLQRFLQSCVHANGPQLTHSSPRLPVRVWTRQACAAG